MEIHLRVHTGENPHYCTKCSSHFKSKGELKSHFRTHSGEKSYHCNLYPKYFSKSNSLKVHLRTQYRRKTTSLQMLSEDICSIIKCNVQCPNSFREWKIEASLKNSYCWITWSINPIKLYHQVKDENKWLVELEYIILMLRIEFYFI